MSDARIGRSLVLLLLGAFAAAGYLVSRLQNEREIARVQQRVAVLQRERDSIEALVEANRITLHNLHNERSATERQITILRRNVDRLETLRNESQLTVRQLRKTVALQGRFEETFPEISAANWGLASIPFEPGDTLGIEYFLIPAWFTETFLIDHQNAESWRRQKDKLLAVDSLMAVVVALQDSVATLHARNALALKAAYDNASRECFDISNRYIGELRKPRLSMRSAVGVCAGVAGVTALITTLVNR